MTTAQTPLRPGGATPAGGAPTPDQAAWIRDHVWTDAMRKTYARTPAHYQLCACQYGPTAWCGGMENHCRCGRAEPLPSYEGIICDRTGVIPVAFPEPFRHPTQSACGRSAEQVALVWLADRVCRWVCPCDCHTAPAAPRQLGLFVAVA